MPILINNKPIELKVANSLPLSEIRARIDGQL